MPFVTPEYLHYLVPIGLIGLWRWSVWLIKKIAARSYRPAPSDPQTSDMAFSIVVPVYDEDPQLLRRALLSWLINAPEEIILVIDASDKKSIAACREFAKENPLADIRVIVTDEPGKRAALAKGIREAKCEFVALVDSDTVWKHGLRDKALAPFLESRIGGVVTRQNVLESTTVFQKITDIFWDLRNCDEWPSQTAMGHVLTCLSGRTALYRRKILLPILDAFQNEYIFGRKKESGDDKCLTRYHQEAGGHSAFQSSAQVYSSAAPDFRTFWDQRIRWTRNSFNSDLVSLGQSWTWRHPYIAFYMMDRFISPFTTLLAPIFFIHAVYYDAWIVALGLIVWWLMSRAVKIFPHLARRPEDIVLLPAYILMSFVISVAKIYALLTLRHQKWIREGTGRKQKKRLRDIASEIIFPSIAMGIILYALFYLVFDVL
jgi:hyaluronan synthase